MHKKWRIENKTRFYQEIQDTFLSTQKTDKLYFIYRPL